MRAVIALVVIALVTGVFGMSQTQAKIGIVNQMVNYEFIKKKIKKHEAQHRI